MTREEYIKFANALKNNYTIDFDKLPEFCDMAISALSENKGDLISRQAVEDITWEEPSYTDPLNVLTEVREKVRALPSVENKREWIPVSERLPKAYQKVLVTYEEFHWENESTTYGVKLISFGGFVDFIAWQPLPEPYKAESEDT